jgi:hypothetical protein
LRDVGGTSFTLDRCEEVNGDGSNGARSAQLNPSRNPKVQALSSHFLALSEYSAVTDNAYLYSIPTDFNNTNFTGY